MAGCSEEVCNSEKGDDLLCPSSHVFERQVHEYDEQGAQTGETAGGDGNVAGNASNVKTGAITRAFEGSWASYICIHSSCML